MQMFKSIQPGYLSARGYSANNQRQKDKCRQIQSYNINSSRPISGISNNNCNNNTPKFPIKDFIKKIHGVSHPITPNTDRTYNTSDINYSLRTSYHQNINPNNNNNYINYSNNIQPITNPNSIYLNKNHHQINTNTQCHKNSSTTSNQNFNFLSNYQENKSTKRSHSGLLQFKNYSNTPSHSQDKNSSILKQQNKQNIKTKTNKYNQQHTIQSLSKKIQKLTQRVNKNQNQIEMLKFSQIAALKKTSFNNDSLSFMKQNKLFLNKKEKLLNQEDKQIKRQIDSMKKKIKQVQDQLSKTVSKKDFQSKIQALQWKIKSYTPSYNNNKNNGENFIILDRIHIQIQKQIQKAIQRLQNFMKLPDFKRERLRSNRFATNLFSFCYIEKIQIKDGNNVDSNASFENNFKGSLNINKNSNFYNFSIQRENGFNIPKRFDDNSSGQKILNQNLNINNINDKKEYILSQIIYHIDEQGYLLDQDKCYLVDKQNKLFKIRQQQINQLKNLGVFTFNFQVR